MRAERDYVAVHDTVSLALREVGRRIPQLTCWAYQVVVRVRETRGTASVDERGVLTISLGFAETLPFEALVFVLAHELLHLQWRIHARGRAIDADASDLNVAHDAVVNDWLQHRLGLDDFPLDDLVHQSGARHLCAEDLLSSGSGAGAEEPRDSNGEDEAGRPLALGYYSDLDLFGPSSRLRLAGYCLPDIEAGRRSGGDSRSAGNGRRRSWRRGTRRPHPLGVPRPGREAAAAGRPEGAVQVVFDVSTSMIAGLREALGSLAHTLRGWGETRVTVHFASTNYLRTERVPVSALFREVRIEGPVDRELFPALDCPDCGLHHAARLLRAEPTNLRAAITASGRIGPVLLVSDGLIRWPDRAPPYPVYAILRGVPRTRRDPTPPWVRVESFVLAPLPTAAGR